MCECCATPFSALFVCGHPQFVGLGIIAVSEQNRLQLAAFRAPVQRYMVMQIVVI